MAFVPVHAHRVASLSPSARGLGASSSALNARPFSVRSVPARRATLQSHVSMMASSVPSERALIFDCDGVIIESEELHRLAYNQAWAEAELGFEWSYEFYEKLQNSIGGGKEKMRWYFNTYGWPDGEPADTPQAAEAREELIARLHISKTKIYQAFINDGKATARPGVLRLMDEAHSRGLKLAICSAANRDAVRLVLDVVVGKERLENFDCILAGDDVKQKKPDPTIYKVASERIGIPPENCVVIEDTQIGLTAAKGANMKVVITPTPYTATQQFDGADVVFTDLGDGSNADKMVTVDVLFPELVNSKVAP